MGRRRHAAVLIHLVILVNDRISLISNSVDVFSSPLSQSIHVQSSYNSDVNTNASSTIAIP